MEQNVYWTEPYCHTFCQEVYNKTHLGEYAQDIVWTKLHHDAPEKFPNSHSDTTLAKVIHELLKSNHVQVYGLNALVVMILQYQQTIWICI